MIEWNKNKRYSDSVDVKVKELLEKKKTVWWWSSGGFLLHAALTWCPKVNLLPMTVPRCVLLYTLHCLVIHHYGGNDTEVTPEIRCHVCVLWHARKLWTSELIGHGCRDRARDKTANLILLLIWTLYGAYLTIALPPVKPRDFRVVVFSASSPLTYIHSHTHTKTHTQTALLP